ncbi:MAG: BatD family protein [Cyanobacteriota bacterium]
MNKIKVLLFNVLLFTFFSCSENKNNSLDIKKEVITPIVAYSKVDKTKGTIGDTITYELNIDKDKNIKAEIPEIKKYFDEFEITNEEESPETQVDNRVEKKYIYKFQIKNVGSYSIKPIEIKYNVPKNLQAKYGKGGVVNTSKIFIDIQSTIKLEDKSKDIEDIAPIEEINVLDFQKMIIIFLGLFIFVYFIYLFFKRIFKPKAPLLDYEIALIDLQKIKKYDLEDEKNIKVFYFELSETIRKYVKNRFQINALEKNYDDLQGDFKLNPEINEKSKAFIKDFMETSDFYKFSDYISQKQKAISLLESSYDFIQSTKKIPTKDKKKK